MRRLKKIIWFVVTDSARAQFYMLNENANGLVHIQKENLVAAEARLPARELKSDKPGRTFASTGSGVRHSIEPHHDYHKMEKHKFIVAVADALHKAAAAGEFDKLVLVAPSRSLGELRAALSDQVQARVAAELGKDLTKHPAEELWEHLKPIADKLAYALT